MSNESNCHECGQVFKQDEMIKFDNNWVCAGCKPIFMQKLKEGVSVAGNVQYAGFWIRFGAKFLDGIILNVIDLIIKSILFGGLSQSGANPGVVLLAVLVQWVVMIAYGTYFVGTYGATPGKMACGLKVVTPEGEPVTYGRACGRYFAEILSGLILGIGYIMAAFDEEKRALHDRLCNTRVIVAKK
jgi:uncharacterized RDD family membrane protein YckC